MQADGRAPRVVLADPDGLDDVATLLDASGFAWGRPGVVQIDGVPCDVGQMDDVQVVIGSVEAVLPHLVVAGRVGVAVAVGSQPPVWAPGLEYMLRRPLDGAALRLLLSHLLGEPSERRAARRGAVDLAVRVRLGLRSAEGRLCEVSATGARIVLPVRTRAGRRMAILLPTTADGARSCWIAGRVVRFDSGDRGGVAALAFTRVPLAAQGRLRQLAEPPPLATERRRDVRHIYGRRVIARGAAQPKVLLGRDLSMGGMRVESDCGLSVGSELEVALHVRPGGTPLVLRCRVARNDGQRGCFLRFEKLSDAERSFLAEMVAELPGVEGQSGAVVVSEVVDPEA